MTKRIDEMLAARDQGPSDAIEEPAHFTGLLPNVLTCADHAVPDRIELAKGLGKVSAFTPRDQLNGQVNFLGACSLVDMDRLTTGVALSQVDADLLRRALTDEMEASVASIVRAARTGTDRLSHDVAEQYSSEALLEIEELAHALRHTGVDRKTSGGWLVINDLPAYIRCAVTVANEVEGASYRGDLYATQRYEALAKSFGVD